MPTLESFFCSNNKEGVPRRDRTYLEWDGYTVYWGGANGTWELDTRLIQVTITTYRGKLR